MTKVDVKQGFWGENVFYKMQVLHQINRDVYILFTRYGRIGDMGQYQQTPFKNKEDAIKEFCKIFKDKSGNEWENKNNFVKKPKKYQLIKKKKLIAYKVRLSPLNAAGLLRSAPAAARSHFSDIHRHAQLQPFARSAGAACHIAAAMALPARTAVPANKLTLPLT